MHTLAYIIIELDMFVDVKKCLLYLQFTPDCIYVHSNVYFTVTNLIPYWNMHSAFVKISMQIVSVMHCSRATAKNVFSCEKLSSPVEFCSFAKCHHLYGSC